MDRNSPEPLHLPVMAGEVLEVLNPSDAQVFVDLTVGAGGHACEIARRLGPDGLLVGMDLDGPMLEVARERLRAAGGAKCLLFQGNFTDCRRVLTEAGVEKVDGVLLDLGVSSPQLNDAQRGFSFALEGPLDMRMNGDRPGGTAAEIVNHAPRRELERIFAQYGEERYARHIARLVVNEREKARIETTVQLAAIVKRAYRGGRRRIHPATRVFQALRIAVNGELENLKAVLDTLPEVLAKGGRIAVISFHSLEDRIVKEDFRDRAAAGAYRVITKRPLRPSAREVERNPRARSAKLRAAQRSVP